MKLYLLRHLRFYETFAFTDNKNLGVFSSFQNAELAIDRFNQLEGFRDHRNGYSIEMLELSGKTSVKPHTIIYFLIHALPYDEDHELSYIIGVFPSYTAIQRALPKYRKKYKDCYPEQLTFSGYTIDKDNDFWNSGFFSF